MSGTDDVCVLLPAFQEAETVGSVVTAFRNAGFENVLVVDGDSTDGTRDAARAAGARVVVQSGTGKGQAVREAVHEHVQAPYVLMADADATYDPADADAMVEPLRAGEAEHVIGDRFADMRPGAMTRLNRVGNRIINGAFRVIHGAAYGDILSGYRAFTRDSFRRLSLSADGFGIETELAVECVKQRLPVTVVPVTYRPRPGGSSTNLHPVRDGGVIFLELYRKAKTNNPLFYFGSVGAASTALGSIMAAFVLYRWIRFDVGHEIVAVAATGAIILGIQLLVFGVLADMILSLHREAEDQRAHTPVQANVSSQRRSDPVADSDALAAPERPPRDQTTPNDRRGSERTRADVVDTTDTTAAPGADDDVPGADDGAPGASVSEPPER